MSNIKQCELEISQHNAADTQLFLLNFEHSFFMKFHHVTNFQFKFNLLFALNKIHER